MTFKNRKQINNDIIINGCNNCHLVIVDMSHYPRALHFSGSQVFIQKGTTEAIHRCIYAHPRTHELAQTQSADS